MIKKYSLKTLQKAINLALFMDEDIATKLQPLDGKVLQMVIMPLSIVFFIRFTTLGIELFTDYDGNPDTTIHSSPLGLIRLSLLPASKARSLFNDKIKISGDLLLGQKIKTLFDNLSLDWEGHLAHFTGDVVAHQIGSFWRQGVAFNRKVSDNIRSTISEYLHEELRASPSAEELNDFFNDVDALSLDAERLTAQIQHILRNNSDDSTSHAGITQ